MSFGAELTSKKRKVVYDEYTGGFYAESRIESLQRQVDYRARLTDVINKSEEAKYRFAVKQVDAEKHIFLMKKERETLRHNETLQDHKAHMSVLDKLAKEKGSERPELGKDNYGRYPPASTRKDIVGLIENELKEMTPTVQRKREANTLLRMRTDLTVVDRTLSTEDVFGSFQSRRSRIQSPAKTAPASTSGKKSSSARKKAAKLVLPAISVRMTKTGDKAGVSDSVTQSQVKKQTQHMERSDSDVLPSVFITDVKKYNVHGPG